MWRLISGKYFIIDPLTVHNNSNVGPMIQSIPTVSLNETNLQEVISGLYSENTFSGQKVLNNKRKIEQRVVILGELGTHTVNEVLVAAPRC